MEAPLKSLCIACARYAEGDQLGKALAVIATSPYCVIYHCAVLLHARRELHVAFLLVGLLSVSALSLTIKGVLKQPRPAATCALLGNCDKHGMPSSHATVMAFAATAAALLFLHRRRLRQAGGAEQAGSLAAALGRAVEGGQVLGLAGLTAAVAYGRVYLGYHSAGQVVAGTALGAACAVGWWRLTAAACRRWGAHMLRLAPLRALQLRDTLGCPDVHAAEAALCEPPKTEHAD